MMIVFDPLSTVWTIASIYSAAAASVNCGGITPTIDEFNSIGFKLVLEMNSVSCLFSTLN